MAAVANEGDLTEVISTDSTADEKPTVEAQVEEEAKEEGEFLDY